MCVYADVSVAESVCVRVCARVRCWLVRAQCLFVPRLFMLMDRVVLSCVQLWLWLGRFFFLQPPAEMRSWVCKQLLLGFVIAVL